MKQLELADTLFDSVQEIKKHFIEHSTQPETITPADLYTYVDILRKIKHICDILPLSPGISTDLETIVSTAGTMDSEEKKAHFMNYCIAVLNRILKETMVYRGKYCIIQRNDPVPGLASHMITNLGQIVSCMEQGYLPWIDMQYSKNMFSILSKNQTINAWELFFKQPFEASDFSYEQALISAKPLDGIPAFMPYYSMDCFTNDLLMNFWRSVMKQYMPFSTELENTIQRTMQQFPFGRERILGILCRGTDYVTLRPYNHPAQPDCRQIIEQAKDVMQQYHCNYCYLATEDQTILEKFREAFGDRLLVSQSIYFPGNCDTLLSQMYKNAPEQLYAKNAEYLTSLFLLAQCNCLLAGRTSGTVITLLFKQKKYDYLHVWNQGKYGIDDEGTLHNMIIAADL